MKQDHIKQQSDKGNPDKEKKQVQPNQAEEKSSVGGDFNSGVTSEDPDEKDQIEKQASLGKNQPKSQKETEAGQTGLKKEDMPDASNE